MNGKRCVFILMAALIALSCVIMFSVEAEADGFRKKIIKFDGKVAKGKLDSSGNLIFIGRGTWNAPLKIRFSPFVRVYFELVPFIETESHGILGEYTITFTFVPKARGASHQNLRFGITSLVIGSLNLLSSNFRSISNSPNSDTSGSARKHPSSLGAQASNCPITSLD